MMLLFFVGALSGLALLALALARRWGVERTEFVTLIQAKAALAKAGVAPVDLSAALEEGYPGFAALWGFGQNGGRGLMVGVVDMPPGVALMATAPVWTYGDAESETKVAPSPLTTLRFLKASEGLDAVVLVPNGTRIVPADAAEVMTVADFMRRHGAALTTNGAPAPQGRRRRLDRRFWVLGVAGAGALAAAALLPGLTDMVLDAALSLRAGFGL